MDLMRAALPTSEGSFEDWMRADVNNGILLGHKKEESFTLCNSMDGPGEHYAK